MRFRLQLEPGDLVTLRGETVRRIVRAVWLGRWLLLEGRRVIHRDEVSSYYHERRGSVRREKGASS